MEVGLYCPGEMRSVLEAMVVESLLAAGNSLALLLISTGSLLNGVNMSSKLTAVDGRFPFEELHKLKRPVQENKDSSDTEDDDDNEDDDDGNDQDDDANDEDFSGEEGEEEADPEDDPEANGDGESDDDDEDADDDNGDEDEDDDDNGDEDDDDDEDEDEETPQPPWFLMARSGGSRHSDYEDRGVKAFWADQELRWSRRRDFARHRPEGAGDRVYGVANFDPETSSGRFHDGRS